MPHGHSADPCSYFYYAPRRLRLVALTDEGIVLLVAWRHQRRRLHSHDGMESYCLADETSHSGTI